MTNHRAELGLAFWISFGFLLIACEQAGMKGQGGTQRQVLNQPGTDDAQEEVCVDGDQISLKFPADIQSCIDQGRLFNFSADICLDVLVASFDCNFRALADQVESIGVNSQTVNAAKQEGALLVSCGEKNRGKTIVAQWYYPPNSVDRCTDENPSSRIVTACYKVYQEEPTPPLGTEEQTRQALQACLNE